MAMDDGGRSEYLANRTLDLSEPKSNSNLADDGSLGNNADNIFREIKRAYNLFDENELDLYNKRYRFGYFNPYGAIFNTREFLFFTKPDLHIYNMYAADFEGSKYGNFNESLANIPYWRDLRSKYDKVIQCLQSSYGASKSDPFNHLLENMCMSNLSVPSLEAETVDSPTNMYGVNLSYRGSSEASDDSFDFDLEFRDVRYLPVYQFFKAYDQYEILKHHGLVRPYKKYIMNKILHDQFSIYKFLVDEDMETIIYYAKFFGVMPKSIPRDVFSSSTFDSGLSYSVSFSAQFFEDMNPLILSDFNAVSKSFYNSLPYRIDVYNDLLDRTDNRPTRAAYVVSEARSGAPGGKVYKLKWRGSDKY